MDPDLSPFPFAGSFACALSRRERFFEEIGRVIAQMGGEMIRNYETLALLAKKGERRLENTRRKTEPPLTRRQHPSANLE